MKTKDEDRDRVLRSKAALLAAPMFDSPPSSIAADWTGMPRRPPDTRTWLRTLSDRPPGEVFVRPIAPAVCQNSGLYAAVSHMQIAHA